MFDTSAVLYDQGGTLSNRYLDLKPGDMISVHMLVITMSPAKTAELIKMPLEWVCVGAT